MNIHNSWNELFSTFFFTDHDFLSRFHCITVANIDTILPENLWPLLEPKLIWSSVDRDNWRDCEFFCSFSNASLDMDQTCQSQPAFDPYGDCKSDGMPCALYVRRSKELMPMTHERHICTFGYSGAFVHLRCRNSRFNVNACNPRRADAVIDHDDPDDMYRRQVSAIGKTRSASYPDEVVHTRDSATDEDPRPKRKKIVEPASIASDDQPGSNPELLSTAKAGVLEQGKTLGKTAAVEQRLCESETSFSNCELLRLIQTNKAQLRPAVTYEQHLEGYKMLRYVNVTPAEVWAIVAEADTMGDASTQALVSSRGPGLVNATMICIFTNSPSPPHLRYTFVQFKYSCASSQCALRKIVGPQPSHWLPTRFRLRITNPKPNLTLSDTSLNSTNAPLTLFQTNSDPHCEHHSQLHKQHRQDTGMRKKSAYFRKQMAEEDREIAKRLAEEKEAEAERAEEARISRMPGSWTDEDTTTPKQTVYFPNTPEAPEKSDAVGRKAWIRKLVAKEAERLKRQHASNIITPSRKPGLENSMPLKEGSVRVIPDGRHEAVKKDQRIRKETLTPRIPKKHLDTSRIAKAGSVRPRNAIHEKDKAISAKLQYAYSQYDDRVRQFEQASGWEYDTAVESGATEYLHSASSAYDRLLKDIKRWTDEVHKHDAELDAHRAKYLEPAPQSRSLQDGKTPSHWKGKASKIEHLERFRAFRKAAPQQGLLVAPEKTDTSESEDPPAPRCARATGDSKYKDQSMPTSPNEVENLASQHVSPLEQPHAEAIQYIEPTPAEPAQVENALPQSEQSHITSPEPVVHALNGGKKSTVPAATPSQPLPYNGERRWTHHKCNMKHCRARSPFIKNDPHAGIHDDRPQVLGKRRSIGDILSVEEYGMETRRVRQKRKQFGIALVHVLGAGYLDDYRPTVVKALNDEEIASIAYVPAAANPLLAPVSAVNSIQVQEKSDYEEAMELYDRGLHFGAGGLEGKDDDATNGQEAKDVEDDGGLEEDEQVHGYVEQFIIDPVSHNGVYFIHRHSVQGEMIRIDVPREIWLRQNDHHEENLDRAHISILTQLCEIADRDRKMDPSVAGQRADSNLDMILRAAAKFANSYSWLDRWTSRLRVRELLDELNKSSTAVDGDGDQTMQDFDDDSDGPAAHALKTFRAMLAETEIKARAPASAAPAAAPASAGQAPRVRITAEELEIAPTEILQEERPAPQPQTLVDGAEEALEDTMSNAGGANGLPVHVPTGPKNDRSKGRDRGGDKGMAGATPSGREPGTARRESNVHTAASATTGGSRDTAMFEASTGVPVGAPTGPSADRRPMIFGHDRSEGSGGSGAGRIDGGAPTNDQDRRANSKGKGKTRMQPENGDQNIAMRDAPDERPRQPRKEAKPATTLPTLDGSWKLRPRRSSLTYGEVDQDMLDAERALNLGPRNFSGVEQTPAEPQEMDIDNPDSSANVPDDSRGSSNEPPPTAPRGPRKQQQKNGPKPRPLKMPLRPDNPDTPSGPPRLRNSDADGRPKSMPPRRNEHAGGRFGNGDQSAGRGRTQTRDEQATRQGGIQEDGRAQVASNRKFRPQHRYSGQQQQERPHRPVNDHAGDHQHQPNRNATHRPQGSTNAHNNHQQPSHGRNGDSARQTQGNVDPYAQARMQNKQNRNKQNRLRSNATSGSRSHIEDTSKSKLNYNFKGAAARKNRPNPHAELDGSNDADFGARVRARYGYQVIHHDLARPYGSKLVFDKSNSFAWTSLTCSMPTLFGRDMYGKWRHLESTRLGLPNIMHFLACYSALLMRSAPTESGIIYSSVSRGGRFPGVDLGLAQNLGPWHVNDVMPARIIDEGYEALNWPARPAQADVRKDDVILPSPRLRSSALDGSINRPVRTDAASPLQACSCVGINGLFSTPQALLHRPRRLVGKAEAQMEFTGLPYLFMTNLDQGWQVGKAQLPTITANAGLEAGCCPGSIASRFQLGRSADSPHDP
ncbi:uncharacterized protein MYCFIDRAFT_173084 [Pseudocercospora fijiensis CIRAD86]|uniref:Uncharacterized protein n=1 Tax=Pseudocercospora fijiensis (strain CIRAD86) TaxID=383855 RepID=M2ZYJ1_PSEFD|nr:uncharacterized protein MYCFIDRAFT_173084 [Pseudocercospora fijiensis CIRAD86]EME84019.1 hypothetical protein MYCFIDRAFT_173084 [Pseudocercospora fijiensis CIRAD86]